MTDEWGETVTRSVSYGTYIVKRLERIEQRLSKLEESNNDISRTTMAANRGSDL